MRKSLSFHTLIRHDTRVKLRSVRCIPAARGQYTHSETPQRDTVTKRKTRNQEDLFRYTSGRWLVDEEHQLQQRYVKFDVESLCAQAAAIFSPTTRCTRIVKLEGSFNKAFLLSMDNGKEVVAKIPCPNAGPPSLTTASEVATLQFLRSCMALPVPEVYAWSSDPNNPVGAEYIIMEKIQGAPLAEKWRGMDILERYKIIDQIVDVEKRLAGLRFPAYGSLYLRDSMPFDQDRRHALPSDLDPAGLFYIGPSCSRTVWHKRFADMHMPDGGPWTSMLEFAESMPRRELSLITHSKADVQTQLSRFDDDQSVDEYLDLLQKVLAILPVLSQDPRVTEVQTSVLWHTDLHLGNIFVSHDDPTIISGVIDWQSAHAAPLLIQARFPEFLRPPKTYIPGARVPSLPDNFEKLDADEKAKATQEHLLASQSKYYEMSCLAYNKQVYDALKLDRRLWEPFTCSQLFSDGSLVPLRNALVRIFLDWSNLGLPGHCPFEFTEEELKRHDEQVQRYEDRRYLWDIVKSQLGTDDSGWVPTERWEMTEKMNDYLFDRYIQTLSEELSPEVASKQWPFPPKGM